MGIRTGLVLGLAAAAAWTAAGAAPPLVDAAAVALRDGNASDAVALATQALADKGLTPHDRARALVDRGLAHEMLGERDGALLDFTEALDARALSPAEQARALYDRGVTLDEMARTDDAIGDYAAAIHIEPQFAAALNNRANAYRREGKLDSARADYKASIAAGNPKAEYPDYGLGQVAEAAGRADEARAYYRAALSANPQFTLASERLAALGAGTVPPTRPTAPVAAAPSPDEAPIHLKPPPGVADAAAPAPVVLTPPGGIHLKPPGRRATEPDSATPPLKPALNEAGGAGELVQLGAWRSQDEAAIAWSRIARASGTLLAGLTPQVVEADLPGKGRYYRLRTSPADPGGALALCAALAAKGIACIAVRK